LRSALRRRGKGAFPMATRKPPAVYVYRVILIRDGKKELSDIVLRKEEVEPYLCTFNSIGRHSGLHGKAIRVKLPDVKLRGGKVVA
jgi:hypothetical protein